MSSADFYQAAALELALDCDGRFAHITYLDRSCDKVRIFCYFGTSLVELLNKYCLVVCVTIEPILFSLSYENTKLSLFIK